MGFRLTSHVLTVKDQKAGGRARVKVARINAKAKKKEQEREMILLLLANPVVVSSLIYLGVGFLRTGQKVPTPSGSGAISQFMTQWRHNFGQFLNTVGIPAFSLGGAGDSLGIDALQAALLINIASGGNLAGVLSSSTGLISKLIPALAIKP